MNLVLTAADDRRKLLNNRISEKELALRNVPKGRLRVSGGTRNLYYYTDDQKRRSKYLGQKNLEKAQKLAQRDYDEKVLALSKKELELLDSLTLSLEKVSGENVYESLVPARRKLVTPVEIPTGEFVRCWEAEEFEHKPISEDTPEYYTDRGEQVRSKSEILIANMLNQRGIPYRYECAIYLDNNTRFFPDFTILNVRKRKVIYHEHFGMMNDPDYCESVVYKLASYNRNGCFLGDDLTCTWESEKHPFNVREFERTIEHYFV